MLEIACFHLDSCRRAQMAGAGRIEFCSNYAAGGLTPAPELILKARSIIKKVPLHVIIRPREGNFIHSSPEKEAMMADIRFCRVHNIDGIVLGALNSDGSVDETFCREARKLAGPLSLTFHRAIDHCIDIFAAAQLLAEMKFNRILTAGAAAKAIEGLETLKELQRNLSGHIVIMPGGGIRSNNIAQIKSVTGCKEFHSSALTGLSTICDENEILKMSSYVS